MTWCYVKLWALQRIQLGESYGQIGKDLIVSLPKLALEHFFKGFGRTCNTTSLECKQPEEVLLLISIFLINLCVLYIKCLYCSSFGFFKCLNLNPIMHGVLGPDDLGWLTRS